MIGFILIFCQEGEQKSSKRANHTRPEIEAIKCKSIARLYFLFSTQLFDEQAKSLQQERLDCNPIVVIVQDYQEKTRWQKLPFTEKPCNRRFCCEACQRMQLLTRHGSFPPLNGTVNVFICAGHFFRSYNRGKPERTWAPVERSEESFKLLKLTQEWSCASGQRGLGGIKCCSDRHKTRLPFFPVQCSSPQVSQWPRSFEAVRRDVNLKFQRLCKISTIWGTQAQLGQTSTLPWRLSDQPERCLCVFEARLRWTPKIKPHRVSPKSSLLYPPPFVKEPELLQMSLGTWNWEEHIQTVRLTKVDGDLFNIQSRQKAVVQTDPNT